jgi:O-antigen/teichoic acid export membrane protein
MGGKVCRGSKVSARSNTWAESLAAMIRTCVTAAAGMVVLPVVIRQLSKEDYSVFVLGTSVGAYVGLAESGAGSAVVRFCSGRDHRAGTRLLNSALGFVLMTGIFLTFVIGSISLRTRFFFGDTPSGSIYSARLVILWGCIASVGGLLASVLSSYMLAHNQGVQAAFCSIFATVVCNVCVGFSAVSFGTATAVAAAIAVGPFLNLLLLSGFVGRLVGKERSLRVASREKNRELIRHTWIAGYWTIVGLLISGVDLVICARVDQTQVGAYGVAIRLSTFVLWLFGAALTPVVGMFARAHEKNDFDGVTALILRLSHRANSALFALAAVMFIGAPFVIRFLAGERYVESASTVFRWLIIGNLVRNSGAVLGNAMLATGEHRRALAPPAIEGGVGLAASILLGTMFGAPGIAFGTTVGATASTILYVTYVFPRFRAFSVSKKHYLSEALLLPLLIFSPAFLTVYIQGSFSADPYFSNAIGVTAIISLYLFLGVTQSDKNSLLRGLKALPSKK